MVIEQARTRAVAKPWGSMDLQPWSRDAHEGTAIGEIWFQRADANAPDPALLLKLLFTKEALSIQVHPDDGFAQSLGLVRGKTEAWYILSATPGAQIAVGLTRHLDPPQLRTSIEDGSITDLVQWHAVVKDDAVFVPAGTIHAIGPGLVIAEIQQSSDATFRLFDYGRQRELHVDNAVAAAHAAPSPCQTIPTRLTEARTLLVASKYFVLERFDFAPNSTWEIDAEEETWVLVLEGHARVGSMDGIVGEAFFIEAARARIEVGAGGLKGLLAYVGDASDPNLLRNLAVEPDIAAARVFSQPLLHHRAATGAPSRSMEARA